LEAHTEIDMGIRKETVETEISKEAAKIEIAKDAVKSEMSIVAVKTEMTKDTVKTDESKCHICKVCLPRSGFINHFTETHPEREIFKCTTCGYEYARV
jgi:heterodisulfide reductase subunit A-like polyferredoxin